MTRERVHQWREEIVLACRKQGVPPALAAAVCDAESGGRQTNDDGSVVTSPAGALGLMQLMPATAAALGVDPMDAEQNLRGGVHYLSQQYNRFSSWRLAVAAYNAGPAAVWRWGIPPFAETQQYVQNVERLLLDYLDWDWELIWGADKAHAPGTGSYQEGYSSVLGVAALKEDQRAGGYALAQRLIEVLVAR